MPFATERHMHRGLGGFAESLGLAFKRCLIVCLSGLQTLQTTQLLYQAYQAYQNGTFTAFIAQQSGYNTLNDSAVSPNSTAIGAYSVAIAGLVAGAIVTNVNVSSNTSDITALETNLNSLENVVSTSITNYGSFSSNQSIITNDNININCAFERNFINFNNAYSGGYNAGLGISQSHFFIRNNISGGAIQFQTGNDIRFLINSAGQETFIGNLTVSGALQSPSISLLGVSIVSTNQQVGLLGVSKVSTNQQVGLLGVSNVSTGTSCNNCSQQINLLVGVSNQSGAVITLGISSSNMDRQIGLLGVSHVYLRLNRSVY